MPSIFTKIIQGQLPARFVWKDEACVAFLSIAPLRPGHTLVVPRKEVDHWVDMEPTSLAHLFGVSKVIGQALQAQFKPTRVGLMIAGLEVRHVHVHLVPIDQVHDLDFSRPDPNATAQDLDRAAERIREGLRALDRKEVAG